MTSLNEAEIDRDLQQIAAGYRAPLRSPIPHTPAEHDLKFEDVMFPSEDGVPLQGWFISAAGSDKIVVANHPRWFSRAGLPAHLDPWKSLFAAVGNDFEVDFPPDYKILHDAGYNVLAYDCGSRRWNLPAHEDR
jgi:uncharacterized protein